MLIPQPNDTYRMSRRYGLEGFERFLDASIERIESPTPIVPMHSAPSSLDDLARITERSTGGAYRLTLFSDELSSAMIALPWELYARRSGDIFVFGPKTKSLVNLTDRVNHRSYRPSKSRAIASSSDPLSFLHYHGNDLFETIEGDLVLAHPERMRSLARGVVRPEKRSARTLN